MNAAALHGEPRNALGQLRQHILADSALQQMLVMIEDRDAFVAATVDIATGGRHRGCVGHDCRCDPAQFFRGANRDRSCSGPAPRGCRPL